MYQPSYAVGFINPETQQPVLFSKAIAEDKTEVFTTCDHGRTFPSKTKAKRFLHDIHVDFDNNSLEIINFQTGLSLECGEVKHITKVFDKNALMMETTNKLLNQTQTNTAALKCEG